MALPGYGAELAQLRHQGMRPRGPVFVCDRAAVARVVFRLADHYAVMGRAGQGVDWSILLGLVVVVIHVDDPEPLLAEIEQHRPAELRVIHCDEWLRLTRTFLADIPERVVA